MVKKTPRFLADESLEYSIVLHIRKNDYDVTAISEQSPSVADERVLEIAYKQNRIILTNDKDFGDLVFLNNMEHKGIVLFRFKNETAIEKMKAFDSLLESYKNELINSFVVIEEDKVRIRS